MKRFVILVSISACIAATVDPAVAALTHYWPFDVDYGDAVGGADGSAVGGGVSITTAAGDFARGSGGLRVAHDTASGDYVNISGPVIAAAYNAAYSISAWYRYKDIGAQTTDARNFVFETSGYEMSFGLRNTPRDGQWYANIAPAATDLSGYSALAVDDGLWHHVVQVWDKPGNVVRVYHDGIPADSAEIGANDFAALATYLNIGSHRTGDGTRNWDGYIDDVAVWDRALTDGEVLNLFHGASPTALARPPVRAAQLELIAGPNFNVTHGTVGFNINFQNLNVGDHELYSGDSRLLQADGIIIGCANDGGDSIFQVGGDLTYTGSADARYDDGMAFSTADLSGGGEKDFDLAFAYFPFSWDTAGWIAAHVDADGTILAAPHLPAGSSVTKLSTVPAWRGAGQFAVHLAGIDSRLNGMLFVVGGENDNNCTVAGVFEHADDVNIVAGDAALGDWHVQIRDASQNDTSDVGEDGAFSFLYLPYNTVNLIGGRVQGDGTILAGTGGFAASDGNAAGEVDIAIPDGLGGFLSDADGILILTDAQILDGINSGTNQDPVDGNVLSWTYDAADQEFVVHAFDPPTGVAQDASFVFAFVPYENSLHPPPPTQGTLFLIR